jgi:hypothetical protein
MPNRAHSAASQIADGHSVDRVAQFSRVDALKFISVEISGPVAVGRVESALAKVAQTEVEVPRTNEA